MRNNFLTKRSLRRFLPLIFLDHFKSISIGLNNFHENDVFEFLDSEDCREIVGSTLNTTYDPVQVKIKIDFEMWM